jgi:hypothetical protein
MDADFGEEFSFHFPADALSGDDGHSHAHLQEALDTFNGGHFDAAVERRAVLLKILG